MQRCVVLALLVLVAGCSRPPGLFSEQNARAHVAMLASTIGNRSIGSPGNARARAYIVDQLRLFGYDVRVQETDARRAEIGRTAHVANVIAVLPGPRREAIALVSHYDSQRMSPGGGDDGFGVAVSLEAARVLASQAERQWTTMILVTDAEEEGLMGAAALMGDPQVRDDLAAYINIESIGSAGPSVLFETGPGNAWLLKPWVRSAPHPRGGSYAIEIYKRLPNDTDFSVFARHEIPGLNFATIGDSYAYHTHLDTSDRFSGRVLRETGENVVSLAAELHRTDVTTRTLHEAIYFDIGGVAAVSYSTTIGWILSTAAVLFGALGWVRITGFLIRTEGLGRWLLGLLWAVLGSAAAIAAMLAAAWALRASREAFHPWYASPDRFFLLLASTGAAAAWMMVRAGRWIPARARGLRHPAIAWTYTLPVWIVLAVMTAWSAPSAAYLWALPLLAAGLLLTFVPPSRSILIRIVSVLVFIVVATVWLRDTIDLLRFMIAIFGRQPIVTPLFVYAALIAAAGVMLVPPFFAATASARPLLRPSLTTAILLALVATFGLSAWVAPAYTPERPLRRLARAVQDHGSQASLWHVSSLEPGLDLGPNAPGGWNRATPVSASIPLGSLAQPFVFTTTGPPLPPAPITISQFAVVPAAEPRSWTVSLSLTPGAPTLSVAIVLPANLRPARSNLPGVVRAGRWTATYVGVPQEGTAWHASFAGTTQETLRQIRVTVTASGLPGGEGPQRLPGWLGQEATAWTAWTVWILDPAATAPLEPVAPLR
jgi:hypothetical protein